MSGLLLVLLPHLIGDYVTQSNWMAQEKTKKWWPAIAHGLAYTAVYAVALGAYSIGHGVPVVNLLLALLVIGGTHILIDHYRLPKVAIWAINQIAPKKFRYSWAEAEQNSGYTAQMPVWLSTWLLIIWDNTLHIVINLGAILFFVWH